MKQGGNVFPLSISFADGTKHQYYYGLNNIHFYVENANGIIPQEVMYRYVIIPGNGRWSEQVGKDYKTICNLYNIQP